MKLPKPVTQTYVDYQDYQKYLEKVHKKDWEKYHDNLWNWFCEKGNFGNGCFVHMEKKKVLGYSDKDRHGPSINWFADRIFEDYPKVADKFGVIKLWVWW